MVGKTRNNKGITLIALVITIIVLLILAGVAISILAGDNGILRQAAKAKEETDAQSTFEKIKLAAMASITNTEHKVNQEKLDEELKKYGYGKSSGNEEEGYIVQVGNKDYIIESNGKITEEIVLDPQSGPWRYKEDANGRKTIVTNGVLDLPIGTYINYNAAATDADENTIVEKTVTSEPGSPAYYAGLEYYKATEQTLKQGNGWNETYTYKNTIDTNGWRVLGVKEKTGEILILPATHVGVLVTDGIAGYTYGVQELNKICGIYGEGYGAKGARCIDINDVNKITGYNPNNVGIYDPDQEGSGTKYEEGKIYEYGNDVTYSWTNKKSYVESVGKNGATGSSHSDKYNTYGFNWYDVSTKTWKNSMQNTSNPAEICIIENTSYEYYPYSLTTSSDTTGVQKGLSINSNEYDLLFGGNSWYWLATPYTRTFVYWVNYGFSCVSGGKVGYHGGHGRENYYSTGARRVEGQLTVRPVVSLNSKVLLEYDRTEKYYDITGIKE